MGYNTKGQIEDKVALILVDGIDMLSDYKSKRDALIFEYKNLNEDGVDKIVVYNFSVAGAQNASYYIFTTSPLKIILDGPWTAYISLLSNKHNGHFDLKLVNQRQHSKDDLG